MAVRHLKVRHLASVLLGCVLLVSACGRTAVSITGGTSQGDELCANGLDDDADGLADCFDPDCYSDASCIVPGMEICNNGQDDDGDWFVDCDDPDCYGDPVCIVPGREVCNNNIDDDGDWFVDCDDPDCFGDMACVIPPREHCSNGLDDDNDWLVDCDDYDCYGDPACVQPGYEICNNNKDDDGDGDIDCKDSDCTWEEHCWAWFEECDNGIDDDGDGAIDCADSDCKWDPSCKPQQKEICNNGKDDDGDFLTDCWDPDCKGDVHCLAPGEEICDNGIDDDGDNKVDCSDSDCKGAPHCKPGKEICDNFKDDDKDSLVDCKDPDCFKDPACKEPGAEVCNNGLDDDEDGDIDCADTDCSFLPLCLPGKEICNNTVDDDKDGATDCDDPDCKSDPSCATTLCTASVDFGTLASQGASAKQSVSTLGTKDVYPSTCAVQGGGERVTQFTLSAPTDLKLAYQQVSGDQVFALYRAGIGEACNANPIKCFDPESAKDGEFSLPTLDAGTYYLIVEAFAAGLEGQADITLSSGTVFTPEVCNNGVDDDGDLAVDCADLDCTLSAACASQVCKYDVNLGSLVVGGPAKSVTVDTTNGGDDMDATCAAGGGGDRVIRFALPASAGVAVTVYQEGWHALGLHADKGPGTTCMASAGSCLDSNQSPGFVLSYDSMEKGVYYYVVDAIKPGMEGIVELSFQAFDNRGPELCANGIDDDHDGLTDCMDPDCVGVVGCPGPVCVADHKTGPLSHNAPPVSISADVKAANNDQTLSCAFGGGKDVVIEVELPQVSGLEIDCNQSGDHVLGLFAAGDSRDPCDANKLSCADPKTGPLGCSFIWPNLQPGKYYVVVEAFKPGDEGWVNINLSARPDSAQEICNNGVDDDGDGQIDCQDYNCATEPSCQGSTCTPDQKLGIIPSGGAPVSAALSTQGSGDSVKTSCAPGGGQDYVLALQLVGQQDLTVSYAQFGSHAFALYENKGGGYACDAAPLTCQSTAGQSLGELTFSGLAAGDYYLVVDALSQGQEGPLVVEVSAQ